MHYSTACTKHQLGTFYLAELSYEADIIIVAEDVREDDIDRMTHVLQQFLQQSDDSDETECLFTLGSFVICQDTTVMSKTVSHSSVTCRIFE